MAADDQTEHLVVSLDIGTCYSAVAFTHFIPGHPVHVRTVNKWPRLIPGEAKIPSLVAYNEALEPVAFGASADDLHRPAGSELAEWFKLHLHSAKLRASVANAVENLPNLPVGPLKVYSDLAGYLFTHFISYFCASTADGAEIFARLKRSLRIVVGVPNGWPVLTCADVRAAVKRAVEDIVYEPVEVSSLSEAEASMHYLLDAPSGLSWLKDGTIFAVCDAGGSTVDVTVYRCRNVTPTIQLMEYRTPGCVLAGGVFVDRAFEGWLEEWLADKSTDLRSRHDDLLCQFTSSRKRVFDGGDLTFQVPRTFENDWQSCLCDGRLRLHADYGRNSFDPCLDRIKSLLAQQCFPQDIRPAPEYLLLVGGLSQNSYVSSQLREWGQSNNVQVVDVSAGEKAVAVGGVHHLMNSRVNTRVVKRTIGCLVNQVFDPANPVHQKFESHKFVSAANQERIFGYFRTLVKAGRVVQSNDVVTRSFSLLAKDRATLLDLLNRGISLFESLDPYADGQYVRTDSGALLPQFHEIGQVSANVKGMPIVTCHNAGAGFCLKAQFDIKLYFGRPSQIEAKIVWTDDMGREHSRDGVLTPL